MKRYIHTVITKMSSSLRPPWKDFQQEPSVLLSVHQREKKWGTSLFTSLLFPIVQVSLKGANGSAFRRSPPSCPLQRQLQKFIRGLQRRERGRDSNMVIWPKTSIHKVFDIFTFDNFFKVIRNKCLFYFCKMHISQKR